jgi:hypothetical protein
MRFLRLPVLLFALFIAAAPATADDGRLSKQLVGNWMEYSPSSNLIAFGADGKVKIFLKKGEIGDLRSLNGTWTVKNGVMTATFMMEGIPISNSGKLTFDKGEMQLLDKTGVVTHHRRHQGPIPNQYAW